MPVALLFNHNVPVAIPRGLRARGVDVSTAYEAGSHRLADPALLDRAMQLGRVLVTMDDDLLEEAAGRQASGKQFLGVAYGAQDHCVIGQWIEDLQLLAEASEPEDLLNQIVYLPLYFLRSSSVRPSWRSIACRVPVLKGLSRGHGREGVLTRQDQTFFFKVGYAWVM